ncbi:MAG: hypothetical protein ACFB4I_17115 [Cyanophyceae cyanobacterium]
MTFKHNSSLVVGPLLLGLLTAGSAQAQGSAGEISGCCLEQAQVTESEPNDAFSDRDFLPSEITSVRGELRPEIDADFNFSERLTSEEVDFFSVSGLAPSTSFFALIDNTASGVDTILGSFDETNTLINADDDDSPFGGFASALGGSVNADGTINLGVTGFDDFDFDGNHLQTGDYELFITLGTNTFSGGDVDFFEFAAGEASQGFTAEISPAGFDALLGVFAEDGSLLTTDNGTGIVRGIIPDDGSLNVAVTGLDDANFVGNDSESGFYRLSLETISPLPTSNSFLVNSGFETGDFTGWNTLGQTSIENFLFSNSQGTEGLYQALLTTGQNAVPASSLEAFLGLAANGLRELGNGEAIEGSAILQEFTAQAGDILTFDFNFLTDEQVPEQVFNDFAFVSVTSLSKLADAYSSPFMSSLSSFESETGYGTFSFTVPASGTYELGLGVTDVEDDAVNSGLLVDNVQLTRTSVPEPTAVVGFIAFGIGAGYALKRQQT